MPSRMEFIADLPYRVCASRAMSASPCLNCVLRECPALPLSAAFVARRSLGCSRMGSSTRSGVLLLMMRSFCQLCGVTHPEIVRSFFSHQVWSSGIRAQLRLRAQPSEHFGVCSASSSASRKSGVLRAAGSVESRYCSGELGAECVRGCGYWRPHNRLRQHFKYLGMPTISPSSPTSAAAGVSGAISRLPALSDARYLLLSRTVW